MSESLILPAEQLKTELRAMGFSTPNRTRDTQCVCPSLDWLAQAAAWMKNNPWQYIPEKHDCDDAAWDAVEFGNTALDESPIENVGHSVCLCYIDITMSAELNKIGGGGHCTTNVRTPDGWYFLERETGLYEKAQPAIDSNRVNPDFAIV